MDRTAPEIEFTDTGCTFCDLALKNKPDHRFIINGQDLSQELLRKELKTNHEKYDVLLGLSGGVDSSYCLHLLKNMGVRVLCYSIDNHWQSPDAQENIMKMVEGLKVPFFRYVIDKEVFNELQQALLKAGVKNIEAATDHILFASTYEVAAKYGIKTVISGGNWATESIMPASWGEDPRDLYWLKSIYRKFNGKRLKNLPVLPLWKEQYYRLFKKIKFVRLLDYFSYNRDEAIKTLEREYQFTPYGEKHCENIFTWWHMNWYLYERFGIDKRKAHLSSLILSGQISRADALKELEKAPVYPALGIEEKVRKYPKREYKDYPNSEWVRKIVVLLYKYAKKVRA